MPRLASYTSSPKPAEGGVLEVPDWIPKPHQLACFEGGVTLLQSAAGCLSSSPFLQAKSP